VTDSAPASDGLPARIIKRHTLEKFDRHERYCGIFTAGMAEKWKNPDGEPGSRLGYLELFAGPGTAICEGAEVEGCPLIAARVGTLFSRLAFVENDSELAVALEHRLRTRGFGPDRALVIPGDANDPAVLRSAMDFLPGPAGGLIYSFIDPEDINGDWRAITFLANRRRRWPGAQRVDFLINFPIGPMKRNFANDARISKVLGTDEWKSRVDAGEPLGLVFRETFARQFWRLGFETAKHMEIRAVGSETPLYDLVFASGSPRGIDFWKKIQKIQPSGQRELFSY
jgi:three-Cys-motif partner protein